MIFLETYDSNLGRACRALYSRTAARAERAGTHNGDSVGTGEAHPSRLGHRDEVMKHLPVPTVNIWLLYG
jgi:hypothetical protein